MEASGNVIGRRHKPDYVVFVLTCLLMLIGLVVVYSISPGLAASQSISQNYFIGKQLIDVALGLGAFALAAFFPIRNWLRLTTPLAIVAAVGALLVMFTPINEVYQAHRWIRVGGFSFQIAELIKLALILWLAKFLTQHRRDSKEKNERTILVPIAVLVLLIGLVVAKFQSDLGSAAVMVAILVAMIYSAGVSMRKLALLSVAIILLVALAILSSGYRRDRVASFLHPSENCQTTSYQSCQALISVGSGGLLGQGLGYGVQAYGYQPEASNDSIFAIIAEKLGFIGTTAIILIYALFIKRIKDIIVRTPDLYSRLLVIGVLAWFASQMIINIGAMLGLLPLKGITLPLISQGGTSLVCLTAALGIVFQVSRYTSYREVSINDQNEKSYDYRTNGRRLGRSYNPPVVTRPRY